jgi:hypothetical protein
MAINIFRKVIIQAVLVQCLTMPICAQAESSDCSITLERDPTSEIPTQIENTRVELYVAERDGKPETETMQKRLQLALFEKKLRVASTEVVFQRKLAFAEERAGDFRQKKKQHDNSRCSEDSGRSEKSERTSLKSIRAYNLALKPEFKNEFLTVACFCQ